MYLDPIGYQLTRTKKYLYLKNSICIIFFIYCFIKRIVAEANNSLFKGNSNDLWGSAHLSNFYRIISIEYLSYTRSLTFILNYLIPYNNSMNSELLSLYQKWKNWSWKRISNVLKASWLMERLNFVWFQNSSFNSVLPPFIPFIRIDSI